MALRGDGLGEEADEDGGHDWKHSDDQPRQDPPLRDQGSPEEERGGQDHAGGRLPRILDRA